MHPQKKLSQLEVEVQGAPKRVQIVLRSAAAQHIIRTDPTGRALASNIEPGFYAATIQRSGRKATEPRKVAIGAGRTRLVVGPRDAL